MNIERPTLFDDIMGVPVPTLHRAGAEQRAALVETAQQDPQPWRCACGFLNTPSQRACGSCRIRVRPETTTEAPGTCQCSREEEQPAA